MTVPSRCRSTSLPAADLAIAGAPARESFANPFKLVDLQARRVEYLRVSVTDRCNFRCTYCMPADGVDVVPRAEILTFAEVQRLVQVFVGLGVRKVRVTGGEPLVRRDVVELVRGIAGIAGAHDLAMTTNGQLLPELAKPLRDAGLQRLNVSLDTLDPVRFRELTRQGEVASVLAGLDAADAAGFLHTKLNAVVLRGLNDGELGRLTEFAGDRGYVLRFIEYMPIGLDAAWGPQSFVPAAEMRVTLVREGWDLAPDPTAKHPGGGPAVHWRARKGRHDVALGFIAAVSEKFCKLCNRVRLSATGILRECLSTAGTLSLRDMLRAGATDAELAQAATNALHGKVDGHRFDAAVQTREAMSSIGG
jgi:cyclic pyranopterin phosphate synthase